MIRSRKHLSRRIPVRDGFDNFTLRLGMKQDNQLARGGYVPGAYQTRNRMELEDMYRSSWIVDRMVNVVAEDMIRGGIDIRAQLAPGEIDELQRGMQASGVRARLSDAIKWGRLYGGALAVILIDGEDLSVPLDMDTIQQGRFRGLYVLDRWQVAPSTELITGLGPSLGYPEYYTVNTDAMQGQRVHHSRALRFVGVELPYNQRISEQHWGGSVVDRAYDRILALDSATQGAANLMYKSFLRVVGIDGLRQVIAAGGKAEKSLLKMFDLIRQMQSNEGITLLDKNDTFQTAGFTFAGVYDALQAFAEQIAGATGIPLVRLLGQSPKGFSTGESDLRTYYDTIATLQDDDLRPAYDLLYRIMARHLWGRPLPEGFTFDFLSLYQPSDVEKSQIATGDAQAVAALYQAGLLTKAQALAALRDAGRFSGRFAGIDDEAIAAAEKEEAAPAAILPDMAALPEQGAGQ